MSAVQLLRERDERTGTDLQGRPRSEPAANEGVRLVCVICSSPVTTTEARIVMSGRHDHVFVNPHGLRFHIGCFAAAPGCRAVGAESTFWTWFPGFAWRIAECRSCATHLGWLFGSGDSVFHGLILDRLAEEATGPDP
jgi:hypothetical protein